MIYISLPILVPAALSVVIVRISLAAHSSRRRIKLMESEDSYSSKLINIAAELEKEMEDTIVEFRDKPETQSNNMATEEPEVSEEKWWKPCSHKAGAEHPKFCSCHKAHKQATVDSVDSSSSSLSGKSADKIEEKPCKWHSWRNKKSKYSTGTSTPTSRAASPAPHTSETDHPKSCSCSSKEKQKKSTGPVLTELQLEMAASLNKLPNLKKERAFFDSVRNAHAVIVCRDDGRFTQRGANDGAIRHWVDTFVF